MGVILARPSFCQVQKAGRHSRHIKGDCFARRIPGRIDVFAISARRVGVDFY